jgi:hypothetical protein
MASRLRLICSLSRVRTSASPIVSRAFSIESNRVESSFTAWLSSSLLANSLVWAAATRIADFERTALAFFRLTGRTTLLIMHAVKAFTNGCFLRSHQPDLDQAAESFGAGHAIRRCPHIDVRNSAGLKFGLEAFAVLRTGRSPSEFCIYNFRLRRRGHLGKLVLEPSPYATLRSRLLPPDRSRALPSRRFGPL